MSGLGFARFGSGSGWWFEVFVAGMHFGGEAMSRGDFLEESGELIDFGGFEAGAHELVVSVGDVADFGQNFRAAGREVKRVEAAVLSILSARYELSGFEGVDDGDETAGVHAKGFGEELLTDAGGLAKQAKDAGVGRGKLEGRTPGRNVSRPEREGRRRRFFCAPACILLLH